MKPSSSKPPEPTTAGDSRKFGAIIFDMDGLMVDTERLYIQANEAIAREYGKQVTRATIAKMMGRGTIESLRIFAQDLQIDAAPLALSEQRQRIMQELMESDLVVMPGLRELLDYAKPRFKLGLATGSAARLMTSVLCRLDVEHYFEVRQSSDNIEFGKPHPEIYLRTCEALGVKPRDCVVLEDSSNGVRSGAAAGCFVIAVPNEHTMHQDLTQAQHRCSDLHEVQQWLGRHVAVRT